MLRRNSHAVGIGVMGRDRVCYICAFSHNMNRLPSESLKREPAPYGPKLIGPSVFESGLIFSPGRNLTRQVVNI